MPESPAVLIRRAASKIRQLAGAASPGVWHEMCLGSEGCSVLNNGRLRDRKHVSFSGRKEWKADHADAEYIASWHPLVAVAVADWLEGRARDADCAREEDSVWGPWDLGYCDEPGGVEEAVKVARAYLANPAETEA